MDNGKTPNKKEEPKFKTDGGKTKSNAIEIPSINLPKGGGAIKGIDQKFSVNAVNGTSAFSIPLPVSAARGAVPSLSLSYNSGGGNGIFGLGWNLSLPSIKRKTDKELPQYNDYIDSDTYLLSEAEDLVPEFERNDGSTTLADKGKLIVQGNGYKLKESSFTDSIGNVWTIHYYKPRIEGLFARIERWTKNSTGEIKWRVFSKDNVTTLYGWSSNSRLADPANPTKRIYEWFPELVFDDKGNCALYKYKAEDSLGINPNLLHNRNRYVNSAITYTNLYPDTIFYGNQTPYYYDSAISYTATIPAESDFLFRTIFDYGQLTGASAEQPIATSPANWEFRTDAFSQYKAGFEIRTTRLCKRVLLFHKFSELGTDPVLVKSLDFEHDDNGNMGFKFLMSVTSKGYIKLSNGDYSSKSLPAMEFTYQAHDWNKEVKEISNDNLLHAPIGLNSPYQFTDLYNEGLSGILSEQAGAWYYKRNNGNGEFEAAQLVSPKPAVNGLGGALQLLDLDGDGTKQIVNFNNNPQGYFEINDDKEWQPFKYFKNLPNVNLNDPNARLLDLNGDGKTDVLITEEAVFTWYESAGREGFNDWHHTLKAYDEEQGPAIVFADKTQSIFLADMSGDGLTDIVRIRNGEVCYWPNLGYGKFGAKVGMDNAPVFDTDADFNPAYLKIADIDGSGTPDLIYLGKNKFSCWMNFSGNSFTDPLISPVPDFEIEAFPEVNSQANITVTDLLGNGLQCIVWSSPLQKDTASPLRYIDLMNSKKAHVMIKHINNMGKEVSLEYTPSTKYYIDDKKAGQPWVTQLHFPVHCVSKVITEDKITGQKFTSTYSYHHGYYDHAEKEFRGFGRVDQTDTEQFEHWLNGGGTLTDATVNQAPVLTRSWFHTGAYLRDKKILDQFEKEYWYKEYERFYGAINHVESALPEARFVHDGLNAANSAYVTNMNFAEKREGLRACKSMPLRVEVFALEGSAQEQKKPHSVSTHNCLVELLQPAGQNKHAIFCVKESEAITYSYERNLSDPRVAHKFNLEMDEYGNVLKTASVVYPRVVPITIPSSPPASAETVAAVTLLQTGQAKTLITYTENTFTNDDTDDDYYRLRLPLQSKTYELTKLGKTASAPASPKIHLHSIADFAVVGAATEIPYEQSTPSASVLNKRLIEHVFSRYYKNNLSGLLTGVNGIWLEYRALPYENYQLAYTENTFSDMLEDIFNEPAQAGPPAVPAVVRVTAADMLLGQFHRHDFDYDGNDDGDREHDWWIRSGVVKYINTTNGEDENTAKARFFVPISYTSQYGSKTMVEHDPYKLLVKKTTAVISPTQALNNEVITIDYRTLSPVKTKDPNDNESEILLDELGMPKLLALYGKGSGGDELTDVNGSPFGAETTDPELLDIEDYFIEANANVTDYSALKTLADNLLGRATARFVYEFDCYKNSGGTKPVVVSSIVREEHYHVDSSNTKTQISFEYSSGFEKVVMKKVQAEPGEAKQVSISGTAITVSTVDTSTYSPARLRWIGNGRTVLNNKGNPVKQYEPYFSTTAAYESFEELVEQGVTPVMYYDAMGRLIKSLMPDGSYSRVEFDSWKQINYDQNDTSGESGNVWYSTMNGGSTEEKDAATKAIAHNNTPQTLHFDTLGRPVLLQETPDGTAIYNTFSQIDIEGNLREVIDARGNSIMKYQYDMLGQMVYQHSPDSGKRWLLHDCMGSPLRTWDQRNHEIEFDYDALHRPLTVKVIGGDGTTSLNNVVEQYIYGEGQANDQLNNLRGNLYQHFDTGGLEEMAQYDFKGKALSVQRWLAKDYKNTVNWNTLPSLPPGAGSTLETTSYTISTTYDALGRIKEQNAPNNHNIYPEYNERGILVSEDVTNTNPNPDETTTHLVDIKYDARGQRSYVEYGNGVFSEYTYDVKTYRLKRLLTKNNSNETLQDLNYWYDAVGNITWKEDYAVPTEFYSNMQIDGHNEYTYDALYRLIEATGRENDAAVNFTSSDNNDDSPFKLQLTPTDPMTMQNYTQEYTYDAVGNITQLQHIANQGSYTRTYRYHNGTNRLKDTTVGANTYVYQHEALHGFITAMPHLTVMTWNFKEELVASSTQAVGPDDIPVTTYYQYDSKGKRLRKITENDSYSPGMGLTGPIPAPTPTLKNSRTYIEGYEFYEDYGSGEQTHSLSLIDDGRRFVMIEDSNTYGYLTRYQHPNHQGSCTLETDDTGNVITYEEYHPFGTTSYQAFIAGKSAKRYRYTGMERDEETGLSYHNARYYIPWLGRWLNPDPIGIGDGVNVYAYCHNSPVSHSDTSGNGPGDGPTVTTKNGQPFINLNTTMSKMADAASLRAAGTGGTSITPKEGISAPGKEPAKKLNSSNAPEGGSLTKHMLGGNKTVEPQLAKSAYTGQDNLKSPAAPNFDPAQLKPYNPNPQAELRADTRTEYQQQQQVAFNHQMRFGGGDGTGGFADKYFEGKSWLLNKISNAPLTMQLPMAFAGPIVGSFRSLAAAGELSGIATEMTTVFRGVNSTAGEAYTNALQGTVIPRGGVNGVIDPLAHNTAPGGTVNSLLTSWTTDKDVALNFALRNNGSGVLLEMEIPASSIIKSPNLKRVQLFQDPTRIVSESEVLLKGSFENVNFKPVILD